MSPSKADKPRAERLRAAAVFKLKYKMIAGRLDSGFLIIFRGVLKDLSLEEEEVDQYIEKHRAELDRLCLEGGG